MKNLFIVCILITFNFQIHSQSLTQSAEGKSTVILKGSAISIDIGKTELNLGLNNLLYSIGAKSKFIYGGNIRAKNEEGIGNLFSEGYLVPAGSINGFLGYSKSNGNPPGKLQKLENELNIYIYEFKEKFKEVIKASIYENIKDDTLIIYRDTLLILLNEDGMNSRLDKYIEKEKYKNNEGVKRVKCDIDNLKKEYNIYSDYKQKQIDSITEEYLKNIYHQFIIFGFGGIDAINFKHFTHFDTVKLSNSFDNVYFRGGNVGLGINLQYGLFQFGSTYSYKKTNNFKLLTNKEYTLKQTRTNGIQTLIDEKKISSYIGDYGEVEINELNFDFIFNLRLDEKATNHILINPYLRAQLFSRNENLLPNKVDLGCGFYFFQQNGSFLGGVYVELPDLNNNYEKAKPIDEQNFREPLKRISFGIVGKYSFNSLIGLF